MKVWIVNRKNKKGSEAIKRASKKEDRVVCKSASEAAKAGLEASQSFDVYEVHLDGKGSPLSQRKVLSSYPGAGDSDSPSTYRAPLYQNMFIRDQMPVGVADSVHLFMDPKQPSKSSGTKQFEIEMALLEGDLTATEVEEAMDLLPNIQSLYSYLEKVGQKKSLHLIHRLLTW